MSHHIKTSHGIALLGVCLLLAIVLINSAGQKLDQLSSLISLVNPRSQLAQAGGGGSTVLFLTSGTTWTVPSDWDSSNNKIECIGGGGNGQSSTPAAQYGGYGGGGGAYSLKNNVALIPSSSVTIQVGAAEQDSFFENNSSTEVCLAKAGADGNTGIQSGGGGGAVGGASSSGVGDVVYSGGSSGVGANYSQIGSGGGGAAGPTGAGGDGSSGGYYSGITGGVNSAGTGSGSAGGAFGGSSGGNGGNGTEWGNYGSGGGGGGAVANGNNQNAGNGGLYGGGGGGFANQGGGASGNAGTGAQGIIVITYVPVSPGTYSLFVTNNSGQGMVTSSPSGINCGSACSLSNITSGTTYTLTASPNSGFTTSWSGCTSSSGDTCMLTVNSNSNVTPTFTDTTAPSVPADLSATGISSSQVSLSWTASTDNAAVTGYNIYRCAGSSCTPSAKIGTSVSDSYSDTSASASTAYTYAVSAYDSAGNTSSESSTANATTALAGQVMAASCNESDVQAAVNLAAPGNMVVVPAGTCTWTSSLSVSKGITITGSGTANAGSSTFGAGTPATVILDNSGGNFMINVSLSSSAQTFKLAMLEIDPYTSTTALTSPVAIAGTCDSSGCSLIRLTNLLFSGWSEGGNGTAAGASVRINNSFGLVDHCTFNTTGFMEAVSINLSSYKGVGQYGDNSWSQPFTFGTAQALYLENNVISDGYMLTENEYTLGFENFGGTRIVARFNHLGATGAGAVSWHGTETSGRPRGGYQMEVYGNTYTDDITYPQGLAGLRGGTGIIFDNTINTTVSSTWLNNIFNWDNQRDWRTVGWGTCSGFSPWDANDGANFSVWSGTLSAVSGNVLTVSGTPWTAGSYSFQTGMPGSTIYMVVDETTGGYGVITGNTTNTLNISGVFAILVGSTGFTVGHPVLIYSATLYGAGTMTGSNGSSILTDSSKSWTTSQWVQYGYPYSLTDITQTFTGDIRANTADTASFSYPPLNAGWATWNNGDQYVITRAAACLDQPSYGNERLLSGLVPTPGAPGGSVTPTYEFNDSTSGPNIAGIAGSNAMRGEVYYEKMGQTAQTSPTSPFDGTSGTGWGTLANRPTTCTPQVGYWDTDNRTLYQCSSTNTWTAYYKPFTYPYPLDANGNPNPSGGSGGTTYVPPSSISGSCSTTVNQCTAGTFSDVTDSSTQYLWSCAGSNGGTTASCSIPIPPPITPPSGGGNNISSNNTGGGSSYIPPTPTLSNLTTTVTSPTSTTITWNTSLPTTSQILYGLTTAYGSQTSLNSTLTTTHSITLTNLKSNTVYHFKILLVPSSDSNFTTGVTTTLTNPSINSGRSGSTRSSTYNFGTVTLHNGSQGPAVKELQRFLNDTLHLGLVLDGKLGPKTITVIKTWQKTHNLVPDGLVGTKTKALMNATVQS